MATTLYDETFERKVDVRDPDYFNDDLTVRVVVTYAEKPVGRYENCPHYTVKTTDEKGKSLVRAKTFKGEMAWADAQRYASDAVAKHAAAGMAFMHVSL